MMNFNSKLENALVVMAEMAKLSAWHTKLNAPKIGFYRITYGGNKHKESVSLDPDLYHVHNEAEAIEKVKSLISQMFNNYPEKHLNVLFGDPIHSKDDLIRSIEVKPEYQAGMFNKVDRKAILNPKTRKTIEQILNNNPAGYQYNVLPMEIDVDQFISMRQEIDPELIKPILDEFKITLEDHITFIKRSSSGGALDAHMLLHTAGHAVMKYPPNIKYHYMLFDKLHKFGRQESDIIYGDTYFNESDLLHVLCLFLHFNAAKNLLDLRLNRSEYSISKIAALRNRSLIDIDELIHEMVAVFIKRDRVKFMPNEYYKNPSDETKANASAMQELINQTLRKALDNCVGKIIYD